MKKRLYLIGNIFRQNHAFRSYILRHFQTQEQLDSIEYFDEANREFYAELSSRVTNEEIIYVVTNTKSFTLVGKLLCTLIDDKLILRDNVLIPSQCEQFTQKSFLLPIKRAELTVLEVQESQTIPVLFNIHKTKIKKLQIFEKTIKETIELLKPLSKQFDVELNFSQTTNEWVEVEIRCNTYGSIDKFIEIAKQRHPAHIIVTDDLVQHIINITLAANKKITLAESCTGGLLAYYLTSHAGVSSVFEGSLITYSNILKENWLAVENSTLVENGAVSESVVSEMCEGALSIANADYALAISGVAGPDGGSEEKPVGTVVIGVISENHKQVTTYHFNGDRNYVQEQSALTALKMLVLGDKKVFFKN